jgi:hypothetical protein
MRKKLRKREVRKYARGREFERSGNKNRQVIIGISVLVLFLFFVNLFDIQVLQQPPVVTSQINFLWIDNSGNEDGFRVERDDGNGNYILVQTCDVVQNVVSCFDDGTTPGLPLADATTYDFRLHAWNSAGISQPYATVSVTTLNAPIAPTISSLNPNTINNNVQIGNIVSIIGTGFTPNSVVNVVGIGQLPAGVTNYISDMLIDIDVSSYALGLPGQTSFPIQVIDGTLSSNQVTLTIQEPQNPTISSVTPDPIPTNSPFTLNIIGLDFSPNSIIEFSLIDPSVGAVWNQISASWTPTTLTSGSIDPTPFGIIAGTPIYVRVSNGVGGPASNVMTLGTNTLLCTPNQLCYTGPPGTSGVGICTGGICNAQGSACVGEVLPSAEMCNGLDDDCDGTEDNNLVAPLCANQAGPCAGSVQTCGGTLGWIACPVVNACLAPNAPTGFSGNAV